MSSVSPASRYPKRKRHDISYIEPSDDEGLDLDLEPQLKSKPKPENDKKIDDGQESDEDLEYGARKKKKTKVKMSESEKKLKQELLLKKKREEQPFPFMSLPAELRNQIYDLCLCDPDGVHIRSYQGRYRRMAVHCSPAQCKAQYGGRSWWGRHAQPDDPNATKKRYDLAPKLLAVSKQIYAEAASMFYKQKFFIADTYALQAWLLRMGPTGAAKLHNLTIVSWSENRSHKSPVNLPAFTLLRDATSLEKVHIKAQMGWFSSGRRYNQRPEDGEKGDAERAALIGTKVYRDCFPWLEVLVRKGGLKAMEDVLDVGEANIRPPAQNFLPASGVQTDGWTPERDAKMRKLVFEEVVRLLQRRA